MSPVNSTSHTKCGFTHSQSASFIQRRWVSPYFLRNTRRFGPWTKRDPERLWG